MPMMVVKAFLVLALCCVALIICAIMGLAALVALFVGPAEAAVNIFASPGSSLAVLIAGQPLVVLSIAALVLWWIFKR